jgi:hypothetical protein
VSDNDIKRCEKYLNVDTYWWSRTTDELNLYPAPFPPVHNHDLARTITAQNLGIDLAALDRLTNAFDTDSYPAKFFEQPPKVEIPVAMNGVVNPPEVVRDVKTNDHQAKIKTNAGKNAKSTTKPNLQASKHNVTLCRHFQLGKCTFKNCRFAHVKKVDV